MNLTCDGPWTNQAALNLLGANLDAQNIKHTLDHVNVLGDHVTVMLDGVHDVKLIRNTLSDMKILIDADGNKIEWKYIELLHKLQEEIGLKLANKISKQHVNWQKAKMSVRLAVQVFSRSTAKALETLRKLGIEGFEGSEATEKFIMIINDLFDSLNSRNVRGYGYSKPLYKDSAINTLRMMASAKSYICGLKHDVTNLLVVKGKRKTGFIGLLVGMETVQTLYANLVEKDLLKYLSTYRLSQDHLEVFFSCVRARFGFNNNPTTREFSATYAKLILHTGLKSFSINTNVIVQEDIAIPAGTLQSATANVIETENLNQDDLEWIYQLKDQISSTKYVVNITILTYIAGYIQKVILGNNNTCGGCKEAIQHQETVSCTLINVKDIGSKLVKPCKDILTIVKIAEKIVVAKTKDRQFLCEQNLLSKLSLLILTVISEEYSDLFSSVATHDRNTAIGSHRYVLMKRVCVIFCSLRLKHFAKIHDINNNAVKVRKHLNKIILFNHQ